AKGLSVAQKASYSTADLSPKDWLVNSIQTYVGAPVLSAKVNTAKILYCPSNARYNTANNPDFFSYEMAEGDLAGSVSRYCGLPWKPFGYNGSSPSGVVPHKQSDLGTVPGSIADIWAMVDSDQLGNSCAGAHD